MPNLPCVVDTELTDYCWLCGRASHLGYFSIPYDLFRVGWCSPLCPTGKIICLDVHSEGWVGSLYRAVMHRSQLYYYHVNSTRICRTYTELKYLFLFMLVYKGSA